MKGWDVREILQLFLNNHLKLDWRCLGYNFPTNHNNRCIWQDNNLFFLFWLCSLDTQWIGLTFIIKDKEHLFFGGWCPPISDTPTLWSLSDSSKTIYTVFNWGGLVMWHSMITVLGVSKLLTGSVPAIYLQLFFITYSAVKLCLTSQLLEHLWYLRYFIFCGWRHFSCFKAGVAAISTNKQYLFILRWPIKEVNK